MGPGDGEVWTGPTLMASQLREQSDSDDELQLEANDSSSDNELLLEDNENSQSDDGVLLEELPTSGQLV